MSENRINHKGNHAARLAAVQALYQIELADRGADSVVKEFLDYRLHVNPDQGNELIVNRELFAEIVRETSDRLEDVDKLIVESLPSNWSIGRLDAVLRATMRAGCGEFLMDKGLAAAVIIDEYINVAREFFSAREPGFVNGVLDHVAHVLGLKMKDEPEAKIRDFRKDYDTSELPNWEDEGGGNF